MVRKVTVIILLSLGLFSQAQDSTLCFGPSDNCFEVSSPEEVQIKCSETISKARADGYFSAELGARNVSGTTINYSIDYGQKYNYLHVKSHNVKAPVQWLDSTLVLDLKRFKSWQKQTLAYYENNGYPFANIQLLDFDINADTISANLKLYPHIRVAYDTIQIEGNCNLSNAYLGKYLNLELGEAYREDDIKALDKRLRNLPLVKLTNASRVVFYQQKARVILYLDNAITDRIDGVVGFAPNSTNAENNLLITGEVNIELNNLFRSAKQLEVHWRNYLQRSQMLNVGFSWPYLAQTNVGLSGSFDLNKFDTLFVNLKSKIAVRYQPQANNYLQVYFERLSSNLLTVDTNQVRIQKKIPTNNPYQIDNYGLAFYTRNYDYLPNPRSGYETFADVSLGAKTLLRNTLVDQVLFYSSDSSSFQSIYDTLDKTSLRTTIKFATSVYLPIKKNSTIVNRLSFNGIFANQILFNELYNYGGFSSLKGFDENELFASKALTYTLEYRYLIGENSNVGLFANVSAIENTLQSDDLIDEIPIGFGAQANIQVRGGILNLAYALGTRQNNPIQFSAAKFHFGIINYF